VLIVNRGMITPFKLLNSSMSYFLLDIPFIEIRIVYFFYRFKKGLITEFINNFLKSVIIDPFNYEVDEINPYIVNSGKED
ncbi:hypothetical protein QBC45DRAFT_325361, partial [Copromyces sp. CBS 386.78]